MNFIKENEIIIPKRKEDSHKGENGRVLVIAGSKDYVGAAALAGISALRSGADIVVLQRLKKLHGQSIHFILT